jgi:hypothetical protein
MNSMPPMTQKGILAKTTQFGYSNDPQGDSLTRAGVGMLDNPLTAHSAALTKSMQAMENAQPGDVIETIDPKTGGKRYSYFADRAPELDARVDLYQPQGFDKSIPDNQQVINLGGGNPRLRGNALSTAGEANVAKWSTGSQPQANATPSPVSAPNLATSAFAPTPQPQNTPQAPSLAALTAPWHSSTQINVAQQPQMDQSAPAMQAQNPQQDRLMSFYRNHPVFASQMS